MSNAARSAKTLTGNDTRSILRDSFQLLNRPPRVFDGVSRGAEPLCTADSDSVSLEVVKKAEKENAHVLRLVETKGLSAKAKLRFRRSVTLAETDLLAWRAP